MKIVDVVTQRIKHRSRIVRDADGHAHPGPEHDAVASFLRIVTEEGVDGYCFGPSSSAGISCTRRGSGRSSRSARDSTATPSPIARSPRWTWHCGISQAST